MQIIEKVYRSSHDKTEEQADWYSQTHTAPHRYLAYRDVAPLLRSLGENKKALDYGCGTGASSAFLRDQGLEVIGIDTSPHMLEQAKSHFPDLIFCEPHEIKKSMHFDVVFSSFVLFELGSRKDIINYLRIARSYLRKNGLFIGITGSESLYCVSRNWVSFDVRFDENQKLSSGDIAKLVLKDVGAEFYDYFWTEDDYIDCFEKSGLEIIRISHPLGLPTDPYPWQDERRYPPFTVFIAKRC